MFVALAIAITPQTAVLKARGPEIGLKSFDRYEVVDRTKRPITFYLSTGSEKLPLIVVIQGSGGQSEWIKMGDRVGGSLQALALAVSGGKARVMSIEKPGVPFLFQPKQPGSAEGCSEAFLKEHTLDRWSAAIRASIEGAVKLPQVDAKRVLVIGHSEGAMVAAKVGAECSAVTHVASLGGGMTNQRVQLANLFGKLAVESEWKKIAADPQSTTKMWLGHPYRRWSTFCATSCEQQLARLKRPAFAVQGSADKNTDPTGFQEGARRLASKNPKFKSLWLEGADHSFSQPGDSPGNGLKKVFGQVFDWFLSVK